MNRIFRRTITFASLASTLALVPAGAALAQQAPSGAQQQQQQQPGKHHGKHHQGLLGAALKLDSLSDAQRTQVEQLIQQRKTADVPVRQADAQVLTALAQQVEQATIDPQALAPTLSAEKAAATQASAVDRDTLVKLHALLTPAQRNQLVDSIESRMQATREHKDGGAGWHHGGGEPGAKLGLSADQKAQIRANMQAEWQGRKAQFEQEKGARKQALDSFRGDAFDASALVRVENRGERSEKLAQAMIPVLTPAQRATFADKLRARAAHESRS